MAFAVINSVSAEDPATDTLAPVVESVDLVNGTDNIPTKITVTFDEPINITENTTIELKDSNGAKVPISTSNSSNILTITPLSKLMAGVKYTIFLNNITDVLGNEMGLYTSTFTVRPMKAYWMWASSVDGASASSLNSKGITDVFVLTRGVKGATYFTVLQSAINKFHPYGIKVHAWIVCFKDSNGNFVDPSGYYKTTVYVKTIKVWGWKKKAYRVWKRVKVKINGKWKYKKKKVIKYKWRKGWIYKPVYKTVSGYSQTFNNNLIWIVYQAAKYNVDGIHLDYIRYSGVASKGHAAWQEPGGTTAAVRAVNGIIYRVKTTAKSVNPDILISAAVMPETYNNACYYGQDYSSMAQYLDFLVPMIYKGNYGKNSAWIGSTTSWIVANSAGKPVMAGLQTYYSDSNPVAIPLGNTTDDRYEDLADDIKNALDNGASGLVFFRYGLCNY